MSPWGHSGASATTFEIGTGLYFIVMAMISSAVGGYLAGRLRNKLIGVQSLRSTFAIPRMASWPGRWPPCLARSCSPLRLRRCLAAQARAPCKRSVLPRPRVRWMVMSMRCCGRTIPALAAASIPTAVKRGRNWFACLLPISAMARTFRRRSRLCREGCLCPDRPQPGRRRQAGQRCDHPGQGGSRERPQSGGASGDLADAVTVHRRFRGGAGGDRRRRPPRWNLGQQNPAPLTRPHQRQPTKRERRERCRFSVAIGNTDPTDHPDHAAAPLRNLALTANNNHPQHDLYGD